MGDPRERGNAPGVWPTHRGVIGVDERTYSITDLPPHIRRRITITASGCWIVSGRPDKDGYTFCRIPGRRSRTHRIVWMLLVGEIEAGAVLDHQCHNRSVCTEGGACQHRRCANPAHLRCVTNVFNVMTAINRQADPVRRSEFADAWGIVDDGLALQGGLS
jgi:hypothetical protein